MSLFDALDMACQSTAETLYGERVRIMPRAGGGRYGSEGEDPARPVVELTAVFDTEAGLSDLRGEQGGENRSSAQIVGDRIHAWISAESASALTYQLKGGDLVMRLEKAGQPTYRLSWARPDNGNVLNLALTP